ncbi:MAG: hypothetical protein E7388_00610 [Ruminococcaceae bacterium]|nr:hypothetical protein [Oscillospiraceae bacterium]
MWNLNVYKKNKLPFILLFCAVVLFVVVTMFSGQEKDSDVTAYNVTEKINDVSYDKYDVYIENKLEDILSSTEGVGKVKVAVSLVDSGEIYPFTKEESELDETVEKDSEGGSRDTGSSSEKSEPSVIKDSQGSESVVITKSDMPKISGVIVCAKGGSSYVVQERIIKAVKALCDIDVSEIEILPMN